MEIVYPDNFIRFFNDDDEIDEVGEFEILINDDDIDMINSEFEGFRGKPTLPEGLNSSLNTIHDGISNIPGTVMDVGNNLMHSAPVSYVTNLIPSPTNWNRPDPPAPLGPPPSYIPSKNDQGVQSFGVGGPQAQFVSPGSIRFCLFKFTYIWQTNGRSYWAYLVRVDRRSVSGFRWAGFRWVYFGVDLRRIDSFVCF